ncbi:PfkB family carbohydrate kinase [Prochlorococcus marinus]|uniref:PfkB family carbohydrate kinase n=1 Tax=Prochlorococcus marinus TaxID=1219 RepID=UPI0022B5801C|nr:PfkB family carbohydrate kinase [Prochlorococcus marinus]
MRFLVIGEVFLDENVIGISDRLSPEAPVPILYNSSCQKSLGGAANVAKNISNLGGEVSLLSLVGDDDEALIIKSILKKYKVNFLETDIYSKNTIRKIRFIANQQHILRHDIEQRIDKNESNYIADYLYNICNDYDILIISDYNKGLLNSVETNVLRSIMGEKPILVDSKLGAPNLLNGATIYKPNRLELNYICGKSNHNLLTINEKVNYVMNNFNISELLVTLGDEGMVYASKISSQIRIKTLPIETKDVYDVTGAGDTVISVVAFCISLGISTYECAKKANFVASKSVSVFGNYTPIKEDLNEVNNLIIFTNGCFDVLHIGHIKLLESCKALGGKVIVGLNSDKSVQQLKGINRPYNKLEARKEILENLKSVDEVIVFHELTPYEIIKKIQPDIIVKGGDYQKQDVIGKDIVEAKGGRVEIVPYMANFSTTMLVKKIKDNE